MNFDSLKKICIPHKAKNRALEIQEEADNAELRRVEVYGLETDESYKFFDDAGQRFVCYLRDGSHQRVCDTVIITTYNNIDYLIFVEVKSRSFNTVQVVEKFKSSDCFMDYCSCILKRFHGDSLLDQLKRRFILFHLPRQRPDKSLTRAVNRKPSETHDSPEHFKRVKCRQSGVRIPIKQLI
ncbi:MAG: hypothetical protein HQM01_04750 [Magnetococcales bacterium]|nr:hypothetical protein [Magnetococcales bacterium]